MSMVMPNDLVTDEMVVAMKRLLKVSARMYMYLTKATIERYGREGEMTVRYGLRAYGHWRGTEMRQAHHAMGLDLDMKNLIGCWDNASTYIVKDEMDDGGIYKSHDTSFDVPYCPAAEAWKDAEFHRWGHVYCDEFHQACASAYHPDGNVVIPINLMKGDDHCHFRWIMPPDAEELDLGEPTAFGRRLARDYVAQDDIEAAWKSLKRSNRLVGGRFYSHASIILDRHGDDGRQAISEAMRNWGAERGELLRSEHLEAGLEPSVANFIRYHDMPLHMVWRHRVEMLPDGGAVLDILETPHDEAWEDAHASDLGALWYRHAYPAMTQTYLPGLSAEWTREETGGNPVNRLELRFE
ncbi:MAG: L-2-amino-thiazoline-4-carboxylic acid hydrolase [Silicimonas sp.]